MRTISNCLIGMGIAVTAVCSAHADVYPSRPVTVIVPYTPGGSADVLGRIVAQKLTEKYHQTFIIENRPGASGHIGASFVAKAPADGYTLVVGTIPIHSAYKIYPHLNYDPSKELIPVSIIGEFPSLVLVNSALPVKTVGELIELAKKRTLFFGSAGVGSATHLGAELFNEDAGVKMRHVPYRGSSAAATDLMAGQIQVMFENLPTAIPLTQGGRARAIAVTSKKSNPSLPNVPSVADSGVPNYEFTAWYTVAAPTKTPAAIVNQLSQDLDGILHSDALKGKFAELGVTPVGGTAAANKKFVDAQTAIWTRLIEANHMKAD